MEYCNREANRFPDFANLPNSVCRTNQHEEHSSNREQQRSKCYGHLCIVGGAVALGVARVPDAEDVEEGAYDDAELAEQARHFQSKV